MPEKQIVLGQEAFAAISAVEGLALSDEDRTLIENLRRKGLSNDAIRAEISHRFGPRAAA